MLPTILPEGKIKHNYWYTSIFMNYLQQRCTVVIHAKWYPNGRQAVSMNDEGGNEKVMRVEEYACSNKDAITTPASAASINCTELHSYAELCTQYPLQHRTPPSWSSDYAVPLHVGRKKGRTVVQTLLQVFLALTSTARIYVPSFPCNTDTLPN
ncbi:hypothetical protein WA026_001744 [Henosepilachna vigintioctopunctata]|uniref:Uncharacterized protein n=1 Tax=Henosepilachna vigintioctopunctata TaxID=420089 RepID=A0AAW1US16_9CUCU